MQNLTPREQFDLGLCTFEELKASITGYEIVDKHTKQVVGTAKTLRAASNSVDKRDMRYGAYRYSHRPVFANTVKAA